MSAPIRALFVGDDADAAELSATADRVEVAATDAEGLAERLGGTVDCVVSEHDPPALDGLALLERVRETHPDLPFVLFTGEGSERLASDAIRAGVTDYVRRDGDEEFAILANRVEGVVAERRAERRARETERRLSTLVSNLPGVVYRCHNEYDWRMTYLDGNVRELTGYDPEAFTDGDLDWGDVIVPEDRDKVWEEVQKAVAAGEPFEMNYRIETSGGDRKWVWEQGRAVGEGRHEDDPVALEGFISDVSNRMADRRELERRERLFTAVFEDPTSFIGLLDTDGTLLRVNDAALSFVERDPEDVVGESFADTPWWADSDARDRLREAIERAADGEFVRFEADHHHDGETRYIDTTIRPVHDDGEVVSLLAEGRDVTERRRRDEQLRELHEATRELMSAADREAVADAVATAVATVLEHPIAVVRLREGGSLQPAAVAGESADEFAERPVYPVDDSVPGRAYREGEPVVVPDADAMDDDYDRGPLGSAMYLPLGDHGLLSIGSLDREAFDDADRRVATVLAANATVALDRIEQRAALERERDHLAALFENIPDPTVRVAFDGGDPVVQAVNPAFEEVFGYDEIDIVGESLDAFIVPEERAAEAKSYNEKIQLGEGYHGEVRRETTEGLRDFLLHVAPYEDGVTTRGFAIYTDITDQKERERELERQNERLDEFASVVSHDLRNPLNVAEGHLDLYRTRGGDDHLDAVERAHDRMGELIEGLLALARQGEAVGEPETVDLGSVVADAWATVETDEADLVVGDLPTVSADRDRLRQLLENLFANSVEHGGSDVAVHVEGLGDGFYLEDDGPGIPPAERDRVFELDHSGDGGTGIGLAVVEQIATAHGWSVAITEGRRGGACFEFTGVDVVEGGS